MRLERLLGILRILAEVDKVTVRELSERLEVSKRTVYRDLDTLNEAGVPIVSFPGYGGGISIMDGYKVKNMLLTREDTEKLYAALNGLKSVNDDKKLTSLMAKLVPENPEGMIRRSGYCIDLSSWFGDSLVGKRLFAFREAVEQRRVVEIEYISRYDRSVRRIEPYQLVFKQSEWYLYAFCLVRRGFRLFRLDRMVSFAVSEEVFELRPMEPLSMDHNFGRDLFFSEDDSLMHQIVLEYSKEHEGALTDVIDAVFFERRRDSDTGRICFSVTSLEWTADFIMRILDKVRVVAPAALREVIRERLNEIREQYV